MLLTNDYEVNDCPIIYGDLRISPLLQGDVVLTNYFPNIEEIRGDINMVGCSLSSFSIQPNATARGSRRLQRRRSYCDIGGRIEIDFNDFLVQLDLSQVRVVGHSIILKKNARLSVLTFDGDENTEIRRNLKVSENPELGELILSNVFAINGELQVSQQNEKPLTIDVEDVETIGSVTLADSPNLEICTGEDCFPYEELPEKIEEGEVPVQAVVQNCENSLDQCDTVYESENYIEGCVAYDKKGECTRFESESDSSSDENEPKDYGDLCRAPDKLCKHEHMVTQHSQNEKSKHNFSISSPIQV